MYQKSKGKIIIKFSISWFILVIIIIGLAIAFFKNYGILNKKNGVSFMRTIYYNGQVYTGNQFEEAFIVENNQFKQVGSTKEILSYANKEDILIDLNQKFVCAFKENVLFGIIVGLLCGLFGGIFIYFVY